MRVGVLGINHKSSELNLREMLAKVCQYQFSNVDFLARNLFCVILSTCNRTEIYFSAEDLPQAHIQLLGYLRQEIAEPFEHKLYTYFGKDCFFHLASVTAGLDSLLIGESEIQGQVKRAYETASLYYPLPSHIHYLFQKSLHIGKRIRLCMQDVYREKSFSDLLFQTAKHLLGDLCSKSVFFIGNSEINRKTIGYFRNKRCKDLVVCTRSFVHAGDLLQKQGISFVDWSQMQRWKMHDIVICGTNHYEYILKAEEIEKEHLKTKLIFDLSMPRTVDPLLGQNAHLTLLNIEQLGKLLEDKKEQGV
ncbi:MAG: glutamyl-tRNA reductase, partial [Chlamydiales bacterium]|nr:glutamyl-tRNA reductase [Chlamydiales bacterium]